MLSAPDGGNSEGDACAELDLTVGKVIPTVLLLVDQSGSMTADFNGKSRWNALRDALLDPSTGVIKRLENSVNFGLALYTWNPKRGLSCPTITSVAYAIGNYQAIYNVYANASPDDNTPTGNAIRTVAGLAADGSVLPGGLAAMQTQGPKIIVLATDGDPDSCETNGDNRDPSQAIAVRAAQDAFKAGIRTYVVAVGNSLNVQNQRQVANAGAGLPPDTANGAPYYRTSDQAGLATALNQIIYGERPCKFTFNGAVQAGNEASGSVTLDGAGLRYGDPNGWRLSGPSELELMGSACATVKSSNARLSVSFPCGAVVPLR